MARRRSDFGHNGSTGTYSWADPGTGTICVVLTSLYEAAVRPPSSFQWGWSKLPVEV